jgi:cyclophilin family peptidyl-prolyl cis-trans isomerase
MMNPRRPRLTWPFALLCGLLLAGCGGGASSSEGSGSGSSPGTPGFNGKAAEFDFTPGGPIPDSALGEFHLVFECSIDSQTGASQAGPIQLPPMTFELWPDVAPKGVRRLLRHAAEGVYDGSLFHRVMREFVIQGGGPGPDGQGRSPYGELEPELFTDAQRRHGYGVLSLTEPPSLQFFVCVAESPQVWALDQRPITRLGRLTSGVEALEQLASVPVTYPPAGGEKSAPRVPVRLDRARVVRSPAPTDELIRRPVRDLQGGPEVVAVQQVLITFAERGGAFGVHRNRVEAAARARECLESVRSGRLSWEDAARAYSDRPLDRDKPIRTRRISNFGVLRLEAQRARIDAKQEITAFQAELRQLLAQAVISPEELSRRMEQRQAEIEARVLATAIDRREDVNETAYTEVVFGLQPGEVGLVEYDPFTCPYGWFVVRRIE